MEDCQVYDCASANPHHPPHQQHHDSPRRSRSRSRKHLIQMEMDPPAPSEEYLQDQAENNFLILSGSKRENDHENDSNTTYVSQYENENDEFYPDEDEEEGVQDPNEDQPTRDCDLDHTHFNFQSTIDKLHRKLQKQQQQQQQQQHRSDFDLDLDDDDDGFRRDRNRDRQNLHIDINQVFDRDRDQLEVDVDPHQHQYQHVDGVSSAELDGHADAEAGEDNFDTEEEQRKFEDTIFHKAMIGIGPYLVEQAASVLSASRSYSGDLSYLPRHLAKQPQQQQQQQQHLKQQQGSMSKNLSSKNNQNRRNTTGVSSGTGTGTGTGYGCYSGSSKAALPSINENSRNMMKSAYNSRSQNSLTKGFQKLRLDGGGGGRPRGNLMNTGTRPIQSSYGHGHGLGRKHYQNQAHNNHPSKFIDNSVGQRLASARRGQIKELKCRVTELENELREKLKENQTLARMQHRHEVALNKYENTEAELPKMIRSHLAEVRTLQESLRKAHSHNRNYDEIMKGRDQKIFRLEDENKTLLALVQQNDLEERSKLTETLEMSRIEQKVVETRVSDLQRHVEILEKNHRHQMSTETKKLRATNNKLFEAHQEIDKLVKNLKDKERYISYMRIRQGHGTDAVGRNEMRTAMASMEIFRDDISLRSARTLPLKKSGRDRDPHRHNDQASLSMSLNDDSHLRRQRSETCGPLNRRPAHTKINIDYNEGDGGGDGNVDSSTPRRNIFYNNNNPCSDFGDGETVFKNRQKLALPPCYSPSPRVPGHGSPGIPLSVASMPLSHHSHHSGGTGTGAPREFMSPRQQQQQQQTIAASINNHSNSSLIHHHQHGHGHSRHFPVSPPSPSPRDDIDMSGSISLSSGRSEKLKQRLAQHQQNQQQQLQKLQGPGPGPGPSGTNTNSSIYSGSSHHHFDMDEAAPGSGRSGQSGQSGSQNREFCALRNYSPSSQNRNRNRNQGNSNSNSNGCLSGRSSNLSSDRRQVAGTGTGLEKAADGRTNCPNLDEYYNFENVSVEEDTSYHPPKSLFIDALDSSCNVSSMGQSPLDSMRSVNQHQHQQYPGSQHNHNSILNKYSPRHCADDVGTGQGQGQEDSNNLRTSSAGPKFRLPANTNSFTPSHNPIFRGQDQHQNQNQPCSGQGQGQGQAKGQAQAYQHQNQQQLLTLGESSQTQTTKGVSKRCGRPSNQCQYQQGKGHKVNVSGDTALTAQADQHQHQHQHSRELNGNKLKASQSGSEEGPSSMTQGGGDGPPTSPCHTARSNTGTGTGTGNATRGSVESGFILQRSRQDTQTRSKNGPGPGPGQNQSTKETEELGILDMTPRTIMSKQNSNKKNLALLSSSSESESESESQESDSTQNDGNENDKTAESNKKSIKNNILQNLKKETPRKGGAVAGAVTSAGAGASPRSKSEADIPPTNQNGASVKQVMKQSLDNNVVMIEAMFSKWKKHSRNACESSNPATAASGTGNPTTTTATATITDLARTLGKPAEETTPRRKEALLRKLKAIDQNQYQYQYQDQNQNQAHNTDFDPEALANRKKTEENVSLSNPAYFPNQENDTFETMDGIKAANELIGGTHIFKPSLIQPFFKNNNTSKSSESLAVTGTGAGTGTGTGDAPKANSIKSIKQPQLPWLNVKKTTTSVKENDDNNNGNEIQPKPKPAGDGTGTGETRSKIEKKTLQTKPNSSILEPRNTPGGIAGAGARTSPRGCSSSQNNASPRSRKSSKSGASAAEELPRKKFSIGTISSLQQSQIQGKPGITDVSSSNSNGAGNGTGAGTGTGTGTVTGGIVLNRATKGNPPPSWK